MMNQIRNGLGCMPIQAIHSKISALFNTRGKLSSRTRTISQIGPATLTKTTADLSQYNPQFTLKLERKSPDIS